MTTFAMTLPLARMTPLHMPRRDLVLDASDDLLLQLTLAASDVPAAAPLNLSGVGPVVRFLIWYGSLSWDYGRGWANGGAVLSSTTAVIAPGTAAAGRADVTLARGYGTGWGQRLGWSVQLDLGGALSTLAYGALHLHRASAATQVIV
jgi:hypothetical protein